MPETLTSRFVVVDPRKAIPADLRGRFGFEAITADHPSMASPSALAQGGTPFPLLARLRREPYLLVSRTGPAGWPPESLHEAYTEAGALALLTGGALLDPLLARFVPSDGPEYVRDGPAEFAVRHWVRVMGSAEQDGLCMTTMGLSRLGLPELRSAGLPPYLGQAWARVLTMVAYRLLQDMWRDLEQDPAGGSLEISDEPAIGPYEMAMALGAEPGHSSKVKVGLRLDAAHLTLVPPRGFDGTAAHWCREAVIMLFPAARV